MSTAENKASFVTRANKIFAAATAGYHVVEDWLAEVDKVVGRITAYGTHVGELFGIPATGRQVRMSAIAIWRIRDGKIVEHWHEEDNLGFLQQLGVVPTPEPAPD